MADTANSSTWRERVGDILRRLGLVRSTSGWTLFVSRDTALPGRSGTCSCGAVARRDRGPSVAPSAWGRPVPDLKIGLCEACFARSWRRTLWAVGTVLWTGVSGVGLARLVMGWWPWSPWWGLVASSFLGVVLAWGVGVWVLSLGAPRRDRWHGVPVRVAACAREGWTVEVASQLVVDALDPKREKRVDKVLVERDYLPAGLAGLAVVLAVATVFWSLWHPVVRVVNVSSLPLEIVVDERSLGVIPGVPGEAPGAGREFRLPQGRRVFRAVRLDGVRVDESTGWVGSGRTQLYVPGSTGRCFRLEQRAYGRAAQPKPETLDLAADRRFHTLPVPVDAWFQPNPPSQRNVWFSGGVRRTVRQGPCTP